MTDRKDLGPFHLDCDAPAYNVVESCGEWCGIVNAKDVPWVKIEPPKNAIVVTATCLRCDRRMVYFSWDFHFDDAGTVTRIRLAQCKQCKKVFWYEVAGG